MNTGSTKRRNVRGGMRSLVLNVATAVAAVVIAVFLLLSTHSINMETEAMQQTYDRYVAAEASVNDFMEATTYLTAQSRLFFATHHATYLDNYFWEESRSQRREAAVAAFRRMLPQSSAVEHMDAALEFANKLAKSEKYSMKLLVMALNLNVSDDIAAALDAIRFTQGDQLLSTEDMAAKAHMLVTYEPYEHEVDLVSKQIEQCKEELAEELAAETQRYEATLNGLFLRQQILTVVLLVMVLFTAIVFITTVFKPLSKYIAHIDRNERIEEKGASELRILARAYNTMFDANTSTQRRLLHEADHDALTGLYNRGAYEKYMAERHGEPLAVAIIDIDRFKEVNDQYGHAVGDFVLQRVAGALRESFRTSDFPCRLGGDEFMVVMSGILPENRDVIVRKAGDIAKKLRVPDEKTPAIFISAGVAFGSGEETPDDLYRLADQALYRVKDAGRRGLAFYDEECVRNIVPFRASTEE